MSSIQTNVDSLFGLENLRVTNEFQSRTIQRLTSGYRINSSADDAAGLAIANKFRSDIAELIQGVRNANDGISALQIVDGGLNNISKTIDRLKTLATQSASTTFTGDRNTLHTEYQALLGEIDRQAANIGLIAGGRYNTNIVVYVGGSDSQANAQVAIDLSGAGNQVDATALGIAQTSVAGGGTALSGNSIRLDNSATQFLAGATQQFDFRIYSDTLGAATNVAVTVTGSPAGLSGQEVLAQLNAALSSYGIAASVSSEASSLGQIQFSAARAFSVSAAAASGGNAVAAATSNAVNLATYRHAADNAFITDGTAAEIVTFQNERGAVTITLNATNGNNLANSLATLNTNLAALGIYAVADGAGTGISIQSATSFSIFKQQAATAGAVIDGGAGAKAVSEPAPTASATGNALAALSALTSAVSRLGLVQGRVGTGQNKLQYAIALAQSQITNFSAAQSRIRDADVAAEAANLTKAQVLQQASLAALAQANAAPQSVLTLLRG